MGKLEVCVLSGRVWLFVTISSVLCVSWPFGGHIVSMQQHKNGLTVESSLLCKERVALKALLCNPSIQPITQRG